MNKGKAAIVGAGFVGASIAFSLMLDNALDEIVLIDIDMQVISAIAVTVILSS